MNSFEDLLKIDVERQIGFRIKTSREAKDLLELLSKQQVHTISLSTIRRFWGLIPYTKPNVSTLDTFAQFVGFLSFKQYVKSKNQREIWHTDFKIQQLKDKARLTSKDFELLTQYLNATQSVFALVNLFEVAFYRKKWQYILDLVKPGHISLFNKDGIEPVDYSSHFSFLIFRFLYSLPEEHFKQSLAHLITNTDFRFGVIYCYVDYNNSNGRYGFILNQIKQLKDLNDEETLFLSLFEGLKGYLNKSSQIPTINCPKEQLHQYPVVLVGRYYGYQILCAEQEQDDKAILQNLKTFFKYLDKHGKHSKTLQEFVLTMFVCRKFEILQQILFEYYEAIFEYQRFFTFADTLLYNLIDILNLIQQQKTKDALKLFQKQNSNLSLVEARYNILLIFYHIIGYHIEVDPNRQIAHKNNYLDMSKSSKLSLFDRSYLKGFLG